MRVILQKWVHTNRAILANAGSLASTASVTSLLGFVYWWLAARHFPAEAVGLASAAVSAMMLLGSLSSLGLGTSLIGELPRRLDKKLSLIVTAVIVAGIAGLVLGFLFGAAAADFTVDLQPLSAGLAALTLFALGVGLNSVTIVIDEAVIGLLRGGLQLWRNVIFAIAKLVLLWAAGNWIVNRSGLIIYATWVAGSLSSLLFLALLALSKRQGVGVYQPQWRRLRHLGRLALGHHGLNLVLQGPSLALPILTAILLSAATNAYFYAAWMIARLIFAVPVSLTVVLHAVGVAETASLARKMQQTLLMSVLAGLLANIVLLVGAEFALGLFGQAYAEQAGWTLRVLALSIFPLTVRYHYIAIARIHNWMVRATLIMAVGGLLELALAVVGARMGGLLGLSIGWVAAVCVEAMAMARPVYQTAVVAGWFTPPAAGSRDLPPAPSPAPGIALPPGRPQYGGRS